MCTPQAAERNLFNLLGLIPPPHLFIEGCQSRASSPAESLESSCYSSQRSTPSRSLDRNLSESSRRRSSSGDSARRKPKVSHNRNPQGNNQFRDCPRKTDLKSREYLLDYRRRKITKKEEISRLMLEEHGITMSPATVTRRKRDFGIRIQDPCSDAEEDTERGSSSSGSCSTSEE